MMAEKFTEQQRFVPTAPAELNNDTIGPLVEKVGAVSIAELEKSITELQAARSVTGGVNPRLDGEACSGDDKGAVDAPGLFNGMAIQKDGLSVVSSV
jgi:hypothetical protein